MSNLKLKTQNSKLIILFTFILFVDGCMVGPNYKPPQTSMPKGWIGTTGQPQAALDLVHWWNTFNDPNLTSLIKRAVQANLNLKQAQSRLREARQKRIIAAAPLWPTINGTGSYERFQNPGNIRDDLWQTGLDAVWELDIFGGTRRAAEAATADIQAAVENERDTLVSLCGEVAIDYISLRQYQQEIAIAKENLKAQQHTAELTRQRFSSGLVSALDVANADAQVGTTASQIPILESSAQQTIYSLSILLGREPGALLAELSPTASIPAPPPTLPNDLPSDLLRRRPDIRSAEASIHSATANIGVATADLFPKFSLTGSAGYQTNIGLSSLINSRGGLWSMGPSFSWALFQGGSIRANIEVQKELTEQARLTYETTVLTALQDVENALIAYTKEQQRNKALQQTVAANQQAVKLSTQLYTEGQTEFLNVLDAQRSLYSSQDSLAQSTGNLSNDFVRLYKALGGGWDVNEPNLMGTRNFVK